MDTHYVENSGKFTPYLHKRQRRLVAKIHPVFEVVYLRDCVAPLHLSVSPEARGKT